MSLNTIPGFGKVGDVTDTGTQIDGRHGDRTAMPNTAMARAVDNRGNHVRRVASELPLPLSRRPDGGDRARAAVVLPPPRRLPGAAHPAVYRIAYDCSCGDHHVGLVSHDDLDYGPLHAGGGRIPQPPDRPYRAGRRRAGRARPIPCAARELAVAAVLLPEARMRPVWPSSLAMVAPAESGRDGVLIGVAMSCPGCGEVSVNLVTGAHLDVPFYHDKVVRYVDRPYGDGRDLTVDVFHHRAALRPVRQRARRPDLARQPSFVLAHVLRADDAVTAPSLRLVEGAVGLLEELLRVAGVDGERGEAGRRRDDVRRRGCDAGRRWGCRRSPGAPARRPRRPPCPVPARVGRTPRPRSGRRFGVALLPCHDVADRASRRFPAPWPWVSL